MSLTAGTFVGRDVPVEYAIANEDAIVSSLIFKRLGMMRGKEIKTDWDSVDTTADQSPAFTKTSLVTFKKVDFSGDGVTYADLIFNQKEFRGHVVSPGSTTFNQPKVWFRITFPDGTTYTGPFVVTSYSDSAPYADVATWSMSATSNGDVAVA